MARSPRSSSGDLKEGDELITEITRRGRLAQAGIRCRRPAAARLQAALRRMF